jgi:hypothetical protein
MRLDDATRSRVEKLLALAERGVGGERENAETALARMAAKLGVPLEDLLARTGLTELVAVTLTYAGEGERGLACNVVAFVLQTSTFALLKPRRAGARTQLVVKVPAPMAAELLLTWEVHRDAYRRTVEATLLAYISRNDLYPPPSPLDPAPRPRDAAAMALAARLAGQMDPTAVRRRIGAGVA